MTINSSERGAQGEQAPGGGPGDRGSETRKDTGLSAICWRSHWLGRGSQGRGSVLVGSSCPRTCFGIGTVRSRQKTMTVVGQVTVNTRKYACTGLKDSARSSTAYAVGVPERYARRVIVRTAIATCSTPTSSVRLPATRQLSTAGRLSMEGFQVRRFRRWRTRYLSGRQMVANQRRIFRRTTRIR